MHQRVTAYASRAGYSQLTGGYDGGQAEYVRVPFGALPEQMTLECKLNKRCIVYPLLCKLAKVALRVLVGTCCCCCTLQNMNMTCRGTTRTSAWGWMAC